MSENKLIAAAERDFKTESYAILYAPKKCYLALFDGAKFVDENGEIKVEEVGVYEARVFDSEKELRWLSSGETAIVSDANFVNEKEFVDKNENQKYLLWGQSTGTTKGNWTQFAEARIGAFFVPLKNIAEKSYAQFTAVEYLMSEVENGNVFVADERLTGIELYSPEKKGEKENA